MVLQHTFWFMQKIIKHNSTLNASDTFWYRKYPSISAKKVILDDPWQNDPEFKQMNYYKSKTCHKFATAATWPEPCKAKLSDDVRSSVYASVFSADPMPHKTWRDIINDLHDRVFNKHMASFEKLNQQTSFERNTPLPFAVSATKIFG